MDTRAQERHDERSRPIGLLEAEDDRGRLGAAVSALGYEGFDLRLADLDGERLYPPLALIDIRADGALALCRALCERTKVAIASPVTDFDHRLRATRAGATTVLGAPLDPVDLRDWLARQERPRTPLRVLILDDDAFTAQTCAAVLDGAGMATQAITDPNEAFAAIEAHRPDLMLLDMSMPHADGMEIARIIRQHPHALKMPIVFLSAEDDRRRQLDARRIGGDDFIAKPVDLDTLADLVAMRGERALALRSLADTDPLTGLLTPAAFRERLSGTAGTPFALARLTIDRFAEIDEEHGPWVCDAIVQGLARTLMGSLRCSDLLARLGASEFAVLMDGASAEGAAMAMERVRARFAARPVSVGGGKLRPTLSAGLATGGADDEPRAIERRADAALYRAQRDGDAIVATRVAQPVAA